MLVIFAAFKKEAIDLIKLLKFKKTLKNKRTVIYDGLVENKRIVICITGMGKSNSLFAVKQVIEMNLEDPVFIIQGVSGTVIENINIGDLIFYESIKNLEQFPGEIMQKGNDSYPSDTQKPDENVCKYAGGIENIDIVYPILNIDFDLLKTRWEVSKNNPRLLKFSGGLVSYVVTDAMEKNVLNKLYGIEAIDMESYFIADAALNSQIPVICIRSVSDNLSEPISKLITQFSSGNLCFKFIFLIKLIFSRTKIRSISESYKNINIACRSLNQFVKKVLLPYFGYKL